MTETPTETTPADPEVLVYRYAKLTEVNEWEGETWHYFIPVEGNEEALDRLKVLVDSWSRPEGADENDGEPGDDGADLSLDENSYPAYDVRVLTQHGDGNCSYQEQYAQLSGRLVFAAEDDPGSVEGLTLSSGEDLYKGAIKDYLLGRAERVVYGTLSFDPENPR